jgi:hypothetical protein
LRVDHEGERDKGTVVAFTPAGAAEEGTSEGLGEIPEVADEMSVVHEQDRVVRVREIEANRPTVDGKDQRQDRQRSG